jgi:hypothetical protein
MHAQRLTEKQEHGYSRSCMVHKPYVITIINHRFSHPDCSIGQRRRCSGAYTRWMAVHVKMGVNSGAVSVGRWVLRSSAVVVLVSTDGRLVPRATEHRDGGARRCRVFLSII